jgi:hypothetical protein
MWESVPSQDGVDILLCERTVVRVVGAIGVHCEELCGGWFLFRFVDTMNVFVEALLVGLFLIPAFLLAERLVGAYGKFAVIGVAGSLFHLIAEITGVNKAYVMTKLQ